MRAATARINAIACPIESTLAAKPKHARLVPFRSLEENRVCAVRNAEEIIRAGFCPSSDYHFLQRKALQLNADEFQDLIWILCDLDQALQSDFS
jgi:hypothetical protein